MNFTLLDESRFRAFADKSPYKSFMQTPEIAKYRESIGWTAYYLGIEQGRELKAATMLVAKPTFLGKSTFLAPGGPLLDFADTKLTNFFIRHLRQFIKSHNGYTLHITPNYELVERDRDGAPVKGGFDRTKAVQNLTRLGFHSTISTQPQFHFAMDLNGRTPDQIFADLKRNTRNHIKKAEKMGAKIRELTREELPIFKQITESTSHRRDFTDQPLSYYEQMYDLFHPRGEVQFLVAEAEVEQSAKRTELKTVHSRPLSDNGSESSEGRGESRSKPSERCSEGSFGGCYRERSGVNPVKTGASDRVPEEHRSTACSGVPLSAAMFITYGDEVIYLFSGSDEKYMKEYNAQYLIQWHMIKYAATHGFKRYNFYGISGLPQNGHLDGIYDFKKGFTSGPEGHVIELIGSYELPINHPFYHLHHLLTKLRHPR